MNMTNYTIWHSILCNNQNITVYENKEKYIDIHNAGFICCYIVMNLHVIYEPFR